MFPGFDENRRIGIGAGHTGNETKSDYLKNGSKNFLQARSLNIFSHVFQNVLVFY